MKANVVYRSKIGWELLIPMGLILGVVVVLMILNGAWLGLAILGFAVALVINIWTDTTYTITPDHRLLIRCGVLHKQDIDIDGIKTIRKTHELTSAPALSVDRLEVTYRGGRVLISPRDKEAFVKALKGINPKIWFAANG